MNIDTLGMGTLIRQDELKESLNETNETVATATKQEDLNRRFGAVDMWNHQKRQRTTIQMRRWMN